MVPIKQTAQLMSQQGPMEMEKTLSDYREVGGIKLPFKETLVQNGKPGGESITRTIKFNVKIPQDAFIVPE